MPERRRLRLVRQGLSADARRLVLAADGPLDGAARPDAVALAALLTPEVVRRSPGRTAQHTVAAAGWPAGVVDPLLRDRSPGVWAGRSVREVATTEPVAFERWLTDPGFAPPGGESLVDAQHRIVAVLEERHEDDVVCMTHAALIRAAVLYALSAPLTAHRSADVAACSVTELHRRPDGGWTVVALNSRR